jgi:preprotein translocase subunit SecA
MAGSDAISAAFGGNGEAELVAVPRTEQRVVAETEKLGRNDPCWCGSGKKYKKCHGA